MPELKLFPRKVLSAPCSLSATTLTTLLGVRGTFVARHQVPLFESIIADRPEAPGHTEACIEIDPTTLRLPKNARTVSLKVRGDSMCNAGIFKGDIVFMEFREAWHGDAMVALIDETRP